MNYSSFRQLLLVAPLLYPLAGQAEMACSAPSGDLRPWYWYSAQELTGCATRAGCDGRYLAPPRNWQGANLPPEMAPLHASADRSRVENGTVEMHGDVILHKGYLGLEAGSARFNRNNQQFSLTDGVTILLPDMMLRGERAELSGTDSTGRVEEARFVAFESGVRAEAELIERPSEHELDLHGAMYTQCPPDSEAWSLKAGKIHLDYESGRGVARNTSLRVKGVPILYTPWLDFPVDDRRATGLLWPGFASSGGGLDISVPYYVNLAPNYDLTLIPRWLEERGEMLEAEARYLNSWSSWQLSTAYLANDDKTQTDRWLVGLNEFGAINEHWSTAIDYNKVSDEDYFTDLSVASLNVRRATYLQQHARVDYQNNRWRSQLNVQQYQALATVDEAYRKLPQWSLEYLPMARNLKVQLLLRSELTVFDHENNLENGGFEITGQRRYAEAGFRLPYIGRAGHLITTAKARHVGYELDEGVGNETPETTAAFGSVDAELVFERELQNWRQTLEPRLYYLYSDYEGTQEDQPVFDTRLRDFNYEQLFRESRFSGYDRIDDANHLSLGLSTSLFDAKGLERLNAGIGQIFYFKDRRVTLPDSVLDGTTATTPELLDASFTSLPALVPFSNPGSATAAGAGSVEQRQETSSDIATTLRWQAARGHWLKADASFDRRDGSVNQSRLGWHYRGAGKTLYNFGFSQRRLTPEAAGDPDQIKQVDGSFSLPLNNQWQLYARWQYDLELNQTLEGLFGLSYESCCWTVRTLYQQALEPDTDSLSNTVELEKETAILLEFQLKGLGGLGDKLGGVLEESIFGYRDD